MRAREERDAWVNWPARVAAMIAAELEMDPHRAHTTSLGAVDRHAPCSSIQVLLPLPDQRTVVRAGVLRPGRLVLGPAEVLKFQRLVLVAVRAGREAPALIA